MVPRDKPHHPEPERRHPDSVRRISTRELFIDTNRIEIEHQGTTYRLQITRQGKLILTR